MSQVERVRRLVTQYKMTDTCDGGNEERLEWMPVVDRRRLADDEHLHCCEDQ